MRMKNEHAQLRREPGDFLDQALRVERRRAYHREGLFGLRQAREGERVRRADEPGVAPASGERIALHQRKKRVIISF